MPKKFDWIWFILFFGVFYLIYYFSKQNKRVTVTLDDGEIVEVKGNEEIEYDGETHTAANLFDALKEGYYGKF